MHVNYIVFSEILCTAVLCVKIFCIFDCLLDEKINSMRRLTVLTQDMIRELVPEVGLRAFLFEDCLLNVKKSAVSEKVYNIVSYLNAWIIIYINGPYNLNITLTLIYFVRILNVF